MTRDDVIARQASEGRGIIRAHKPELCIGCDTDCAPATLQGLRCAGCSRVICPRCSYRECVLCNASLGLHEVCWRSGEWKHVPTWLLCERCPRSKQATKRLKEERADGTLALSR
jgi:hypothetical protein